MSALLWFLLGTAVGGPLLFVLLADQVRRRAYAVATERAALEHGTRPALTAPAPSEPKRRRRSPDVKPPRVPLVMDRMPGHIR